MASEDPTEVAADAFVAGFPLVVTVRTMQALGGFFGVNRLHWQRQLADHRFRVIVAPNRDTLYSLAVLDLRSEPMVLELPEVADRYCSYQLLDAWTESFAYLGTRATAGRAGRWAIVGPGWNGDLPAGVERIDAPTPQVFLLGRFVADDDEDVARVLRIADDSSLTPLHVHAGGEAPAPPPPLGDAPGRPQGVPTDAAFFAELRSCLAVNPAVTEVDRQTFAALDRLDPATEVLDAGAALGDRRIDELRDERAEIVHGWAVNRHVGTYGDDQLLRAYVARIGWGANVPEEALYPIATRDSDGRPLHGSQAYRLRFPPGGLPPVHAFWSLCSYGEDLFFAEHPSGRYHVGDRTPFLVTADDGSVEVVASHERPHGADEHVTWLPVPADGFRLMLRLYLPGDALVDGTYDYPEVVRIDG